MFHDSANDTLAKRLATRPRKPSTICRRLSQPMPSCSKCSAQLGLTEALTRRLLDGFAVMPPIPPDPPNTTCWHT